MTSWTVACQAPLSMEFSRQRYWSGWPCPLPRHLADPGVELGSLTFPVLAGRFFTTSVTWEAHFSTGADCKACSSPYTRSLKDKISPLSADSIPSGIRPPPQPPNPSHSAKKTQYRAHQPEMIRTGHAFLKGDFRDAKCNI